MPQHPIQPLISDNQGTLRFQSNALVRYLLDHGPFDMNDLAGVQCSNEDREQFAQLIGYSLHGFGGLPYVSTETYDAACRMADSDATPDAARLRHCEDLLQRLRQRLREPLAELYGIHPDDLRGTP